MMQANQKNNRKVRQGESSVQNWEKENRNVVPSGDDEWKLAKRIPIVSLGNIVDK